MTPDETALQWKHVSVSWTAETISNIVVVAAVTGKSIAVRRVRINTDTAGIISAHESGTLTDGNFIAGGHFAAGGGSDEQFEQKEMVTTFETAIHYTVGTSSSGRITIWYQEL